MKVKRVLSLAAQNLGREDLAAAINDCAGEPAGEIASLLRCYNLIENEIALDYFPLKREETVSVRGGVLPYSRLAYAPVTVYSAADGAMRLLKFELRPARILFPSLKEETKVTLTYSHSPREKEFDSCSEYGGKISARLLSFGVCCEFCLTNGQFAEAATWEKKFREALRAADMTRRSLFVRARRWA